MQTHILSGWCLANCLPCTPQQRRLAMIAASAADIDGISIVFGQQAYWNYHHTFGHNVFAACIISGILAVLVPGRKLASFMLYFALFHLHFLMDYYGSGPDWHIHYLWPMRGMILKNPNAWEFYSWQNMLVFFCLLIWTIAIARVRHRTPLEHVMPRLDVELVAKLNRGKLTASGTPHRHPE